MANSGELALEGEREVLPSLADQPSKEQTPKTQGIDIMGSHIQYAQILDQRQTLKTEESGINSPSPFGSLDMDLRSLCCQRGWAEVWGRALASSFGFLCMCVCV